MELQPVISFDNTEFAFEYKSSKQLKKARFLFSSMGTPLLVKLGTRLTPWAIKSGLPIKGIIRNTIFEQFVGGETLEETSVVAKKLGEYHVKVILDYGVEGGDDGEHGFNHATEEFIRVNDLLNQFKKCLDGVNINQVDALVTPEQAALAEVLAREVLIRVYAESLAFLFRPRTTNGSIMHMLTTVIILAFAGNVLVTNAMRDML